MKVSLMADAQGNANAAEFGIGIPVPNPVYELKGSNSYGLWKTTAGFYVSRFRRKGVNSGN